MTDSADSCESASEDAPAHRSPLEADALVRLKSSTHHCLHQLGLLALAPLPQGIKGIMMAGVER